MMDRGDRIYITKVAYPQHEQIEQHCTLLTVEHTTPKAVLVTAGDDKQWIPKKLLTPATNARHVYLLRRSFRMRPAWECRCGIPRREAAGAVKEPRRHRAAHLHRMDSVTLL